MDFEMDYEMYCGEECSWMGIGIDLESEGDGVRG